jgi:uncharacterized GH25 family protein
MKRLFGSLAVGLLAIAVAQAHFPFIVPDADGNSAKVVFSDTLEPDANVNIEKLAATKMFLRDSSGKDIPLDWTKGESFYSVKFPGSGPRTAFGVTEYGVLQKGDSKPFRLVYLPKALIGGIPEKAIGEPMKVEIVPVRSGPKTRFQVLQAGKPMVGVEVTVFVPESEMKMSKTDKEGFTPGYDPKRRYGVYARVTEAKAGEHSGKKYEETRYYATLVMDVK